jgi:hypothetical protein
VHYSDFLEAGVVAVDARACEKGGVVDAFIELSKDNLP